ncbi:hypothetical protein AAFC00_003903 [Neodothiora populina]|uniref:Ribosome biogenesis protein SLX9 n=1 Tax=Neodothiora populina TaxID=2781224 RepID=A0ABR3PG05_9PEZI
MAPIKKRAGMRAKIAAKSRPAASYTPASNTTISDLDASTGGNNDSNDHDASSAFSSFASSKRDKRIMKHSAFMSKIEKANKKPSKRGGARGKAREKEKQLMVKLEGLVDALPELEENDDDDDDWEGMMSEDDENSNDQTKTAKENDMLGALASMVNVRKSIKKSSNDTTGVSGKMQMKTLKSRPGAAKRKAALEGKEMERFGKNLAQMTAAVTPAAPVTAASAPAATTANTAATAEGDATANRWAALRGFIGQTMEQNPQFGIKK